MQSSMTLASGTLYESCMCSAEFANHFMSTCKTCIATVINSVHGTMDTVYGLCHRARAGYRAKQSQEKAIMLLKLHGHVLKPACYVCVPWILYESRA